MGAEKNETCFPILFFWCVGLSLKNIFAARSSEKGYFLEQGALLEKYRKVVDLNFYVDHFFLSLSRCVCVCAWYRKQKNGVHISFLIFSINKSTLVDTKCFLPPSYYSSCLLLYFREGRHKKIWEKVRRVYFTITFFSESATTAMLHKCIMHALLIYDPPRKIKRRRRFF